MSPKPTLPWLRIYVHMSKQLLHADTILYILGDGNYSKLYLASGRVELTSKSLHLYEALFLAFVRISKSTLINPVYVVDFESPKCRFGSVTMQGGKQFDVARRRVKEVKERLEMHLETELVA